MSTKTSLLIASDHAGFDLKEKFKASRQDIEWIDLGPENTERVDYPDYADRVCKRIISSNRMALERGVLICGSGQGMAMRANRYPQIRAALVWNLESVSLAREHNDANVLCLGSRLIDHDLALQVLEAFLRTEFAGGRHQDRVDKLCRMP